MRRFDIDYGILANKDISASKICILRTIAIYTKVLYTPAKNFSICLDSVRGDNNKRIQNFSPYKAGIRNLLLVESNEKEVIK